jgi:hypothetical protein
MKEDAKKKQETGHFFCILRGLLRALRAFAFAFLNRSSAWSRTAVQREVGDFRSDGVRAAITLNRVGKNPLPKS